LFSGDKFIVAFTSNSNDINNKNKVIRKRRTTTIDLNLDCDNSLFLLNLIQILFGILLSEAYMPKSHNGLEPLPVFVLISDNKFDFYNITEMADKKV
jgi:hypothetical protein